jgi:DNA (cytosine-5)-methyltransferase 1
MANKPRLLDLFCGAGGAGMGYHRAGFEVVGVDITPQPNYPFEFVQADALEYACEHWQDFDAIHASPPCQAYSVTQNMHNAEHVDLLPITRAILRFIGLPYVIENVPGSPMRNYIWLNGLMFNLQVIRRRHFESNVYLMQPTPPRKTGRTSGNGKSYSTFDDGDYITVAGHNFRYSDGCVAMNIDWMNQHELAQSIPPAYTEFIGRQLIRYVSNVAAK